MIRLALNEKKEGKLEPNIFHDIAAASSLSPELSSHFLPWFARNKSSSLVRTLGQLLQSR